MFVFWCSKDDRMGKAAEQGIWGFIFMAYFLDSFHSGFFFSLFAHFDLVIFLILPALMIVGSNLMSSIGSWSVGVFVKSVVLFFYKKKEEMSEFVTLLFLVSGFLWVCWFLNILEALEIQMELMFLRNFLSFFIFWECCSLHGILKLAFFAFKSNISPGFCS